MKTEASEHSHPPTTAMTCGGDPRTEAEKHGAALRQTHSCTDAVNVHELHTNYIYFYNTTSVPVKNECFNQDLRFKHRNRNSVVIVN